MTGAAGRPGRVSTATALWRLARGLLHIGRGVWICAVRFPGLDVRQRMSVVAWWSGRLLALIGVRLEVHGDAPGATAQGPALCLANHVSWLDILALNAVAPSRFVAKADIRRWPVLGWLTACGGTLFIERGRPRDARRVARALAEALERGDRVSVFPEGTTSDGHGLLPFHTGLLEAAIDTGCPVHPVALSYSDALEPVSRAAAFVGDMPLWRSVWQVVTARQLCASLRLLPPIGAAGLDRHRLAAAARTAIGAALEARGLAAAAPTC